MKGKPIQMNKLFFYPLIIITIIITIIIILFTKSWNQLIPNQLENSWIITNIYSKRNTILTNGDNMYRLEFQSKDPTKDPTSFSFTGTDNCNNITGTCNIINRTKLNFSNIGSTKQGCPSDNLAPYKSLVDVLNNVHHGNIRQEVLTLQTHNSHRYTFHKEVEGFLQEQNIGSEKRYNIELVDGTFLFIPDLQQELQDYFEDNYWTVFLTDIQPVVPNTWSNMASASSTRVSVKTLRIDDHPIAIGRPLRDNKVPSTDLNYGQQRYLLPTLVPATASMWTYGLTSEAITEIRTVTDLQLFADHWSNVARHEHSSIDSFEQVIKELEHYGAPECIIIKAHKARIDEIKHAKMALTMANTALQALCAPQLDFKPIDHVLSIRPLDKFLHDNHQDACIGEARSAKQLAKQAKALRQHKKPHLAALLDIMSADEAMHAELGYDIADFFVNKGIILIDP